MVAKSLKRSIFVVSAAGALALAPPASASHQYRDSVRCAGKTVRNVQVLEQTSEATAFRKRFPTRPYATYASYACMRRAGSIERLKGSEYSLSRVRPQLAGRYVAFRRLDELNEFGSASGIVILNMLTGAIVYESPRDGVAYMLRFVVKRNGSAAWFDSPQEEPGIRVYKIDATTAGNRQLLSSFTQVTQRDVESLILLPDRRQILWTENDEPKSAPID
jgi:hypothetical protein